MCNRPSSNQPMRNQSIRNLRIIALIELAERVADQLNPSELSKMLKKMKVSITLNLIASRAKIQWVQC